MTSKLFKYNRLWISYVLNLGCNLDTAKDIVQEFYVKMHISKSDYLFDDEEPNFYGCYLILRNMVYDLKRKEKNFSLVSDENIPEVEDDNYNEDDSEYNKHLALKKWLDNNHLPYEDETFKYTQDVLKKLYLRTIYDAIFENGYKITELSKETGIKYDTLRYAVLVIKKQIKKIYDED